MKPPPPGMNIIHHLSTLIITPTNSSNPITPLLNTHHPSLSLLTSHTSYDAVSSSLPALPNWLYDSFHSPDPNLKLFVISLIPIISKTYLSEPPHSVFDIEPVLLAISNSAHQDGSISLPDLSQQSIYHIPFGVSDNTQKEFRYHEPDIDPHWSIRPSKRAEVVGVVLGRYYKHISEMPMWSKVDFCKFVSGWAGQDCGCKCEFDQICDGNWDNVNSGKRGKDKIELPWEILQPVLRILGHCLLGPINGDDVKDAASIAVRCLYARVSHDLVPSAILATQGLIQLDKRGREGVKKPEIDLVSK